MAEQKGAYQVALADGEGAGGVVAIANPEGATLLVTRVLVHTTTKSTAASTVDAGIVASASTSGDNLMDGVDTGTAAGLFDNVENKGTNGKARQVWGAGQYLTISKASGAVAGLAGSAYIEYVRA